MLFEASDVGSNRRNTLPRRWSRSWLTQPVSCVSEVGKRIVGEPQPARQPPIFRVNDSAAAVRHRQFMVGANAVDPGIHLGFIYHAAGGN